MHYTLFTVAIQCLETTFKISSSDCHLAAPQPLREIFLNSFLKVTTFYTYQPVFLSLLWLLLYLYSILCNKHYFRHIFHSFLSNFCLQNDIVTLPETFPSAEDIEKAEQLKNEGMSTFLMYLDSKHCQNHITECIMYNCLPSPFSIVMMQIKTWLIINASFIPNALCA